MTAERPFRILGVRQVAVGGRDADALRRLWVDLLGLEVSGTLRSDAENVEETIAHVPGRADDVEITLMTPLDPARRPRVHEPALHHVGLLVDDLSAAVAWLGERGVRFAAGGIRHGAHGHNICFIHPQADAEHPVGGGGVLIELIEAGDTA